MLLTMPLAWRGAQPPHAVAHGHISATTSYLLAAGGRVRLHTIVGFNFGDGHFRRAAHRGHQTRCHFAPGEFIVAWVESQPIHKDHQQYKLIDAALGIIETGSYQVADSVDQQPWLPNGPIPLQVTWTRATADEPVDETDAVLVPAAGVV
jgi:hypothetical protein